jgi:hypothetical protein
MDYFSVLRAIYLTCYYFLLRKQPSKSYAVSVVIASALSSTFTFLMACLVFFDSKNTQVSSLLNSLLRRGLSYDEWRTADAVKYQMEAGETSSKSDDNLGEETYFVLLLVLSFSGFVDFRPDSRHLKGSLSRIMYDGVQVVFLRKKPDHQRPSRASNAPTTFGITTFP